MHHAKREKGDSRGKRRREKPEAPFQETKQAVDLSKAKAASSGKGGGSGALPVVVAALALLVAAVGGGVWFGRHRRAMVPAR